MKKKKKHPTHLLKHLDDKLKAREIINTELVDEQHRLAV